MSEALVAGGVKAQSAGIESKPASRASTISEGPMNSGVQKLLERRIREYVPGGVDFTRKCVGALCFADRPLTDREKITTLAICRCYDERKRERTLVNYVGYLKSRRSTDVDLGGMLLQFRTHPTEVLNVHAYGTWLTGKLKGANGASF